MPPKKQSDEQLPPPIKRKTYPKNAKKAKSIQPEEQQEIVEPETKHKVPNKKKSTKNTSDVYDKIEKARNKKVDDFEPDTDTDSDYDNSDDENIKFQIVQTVEPVPEPEPEPVPVPVPVKSKKSENKKNKAIKSTKPTAEYAEYDPQVHFKQEQEKLKSLYDNQFKLLKEENNKLRNLNDYQTHLQRLTHMSRNVKIKF